MSASVFVFFKSSRLPTVEQWNAAIRAEGFDLVIDPFDLRINDGYRAAMLEGRESTFDWELSSFETLRTEGFELPEGDYDSRARLGFGTIADEDVTACIAGAVLAKLTEGSFQNNEIGNDVLAAPAAIEATRKVIAEFHARGPFDYEGYDKQNDEQNAPPVIASAPPIISPATRVSSVVSPSRVFRNYRMICLAFMLMWLAFLSFGILVCKGVIEPELGVANTLLTANDPSARTSALSSEREKALGGAALSAFGAFFYACAAFVPRTPGGWMISKCAIIGMAFPFLITIPLVGLGLKSWETPEMKNFFSN